MECTETGIANFCLNVSRSTKKIPPQTKKCSKLHVFRIRWPSGAQEDFGRIHLVCFVWIRVWGLGFGVELLRFEVWGFRTGCKPLKS